MLHTVTRREYSVSCDGCGTAGPAADSSKDARQLVQALGWRGLTPIPHLDFLTTWLCPDCLERRESPIAVK
jgi:hypothetical protein